MPKYEVPVTLTVGVTVWAADEACARQHALEALNEALQGKHVGRTTAFATLDGPTTDAPEKLAEDPPDDQMRMFPEGTKA